MEGIKKTHPAFGMVRFARCSGSSGSIFGSEIKNHMSTMRLTVQPGEDLWSLHEHRYFAKGRNLIELEMSTAQFAELISSPNCGSGVPCNIKVFDGVEIPGFIDNDNLHDQIKDDIQEKHAVITKKITSLTKQIEQALENSSLSKTKREDLKKSVDSLLMEVKDNLPYILDQYQEAAEKIKSKAAAEIDAVFTNIVTHLGLEKLEDLKKLSDGHGNFELAE